MARPLHLLLLLLRHLLLWTNRLGLNLLLLLLCHYVRSFLSMATNEKRT